MEAETCGAGRIVLVEEENRQNRLAQSAFVTNVNGSPVDNGQHFVGVDMDPETLKIFIERCRRCAGCPTRQCDINTRTFQHSEPQNAVS